MHSVNQLRNLLGETTTRIQDLLASFQTSQANTIGSLDQMTTRLEKVTGDSTSRLQDLFSGFQTMQADTMGNLNQITSRLEKAVGEAAGLVREAGSNLESAVDRSSRLVVNTVVTILVLQFTWFVFKLLVFHYMNRRSIVQTFVLGSLCCCVGFGCVNFLFRK